MQDITTYLKRWESGDVSALHDLFPLIYSELRAAAQGALRIGEPAMLQPTALVHDVYLRLVDQTHPQWSGRAHFFAVASKAMRRLVIDHLRAQGASKRGGNRASVTMTGLALDDSGPCQLDALALDEALDRLALLDNRKARVVELRFFGGLTNEETAAALGVSRSTVADDWTFARAWLADELAEGNGG